MVNEYLATYLNDHLAGSVAAVEHLEHLEAAYAETDLASFLVELRRDISADRKDFYALSIVCRFLKAARERSQRRSLN